MKKIKLVILFLVGLVYFSVSNVYALGVGYNYDFDNITLPEYYQTGNWLTNKLNEAQTNSNMSNGINFVFYTDPHFAANAGYSAELIRQLKTKTNFQLVINGGDQARAYGNQTNLENDATTFYNFTTSLTKVGIPVYTIRGNHDYTIRASSSDITGYTPSHAWVYNKIMSTIDRTKIVGPENKLYYYVDDAAHKVRYLFIDGYEYVREGNKGEGVQAQITDEQMSWILNTALNVDGYKFVVTTHAPADPKIEWNESAINKIHQLEAAINNRRKFYISDSLQKDFTDTTNYVLCHLNGHTHFDKHSINDGVLSISTTGDATYNDDQAVTRTSGATSEHAFDFFSIDLAAKTIKTVRIGGGKNRSWTYTEPNAQLHINIVDDKNVNVTGTNITVEGTKGYKKSFTNVSSQINITNLPYDTYTIKQTNEIPGYAKSENVTVKLDSTNSNKTTSLVNKKNKVIVYSYDEKGNTQIPGIEFEIRDKQNKVVNYCTNAAGEKNKPCKWTSNGEPYTIEAIPSGEYKLVVVKMPSGYYKTKDVSFVLNGLDSTKILSVINKQTQLIIKNGVVGSTLEIIDQNNEVVSYCTNDKGQINNKCSWKVTEKEYVIKGIPIGNYTLVEKNTVNGTPVEKKTKFSIEDNGAPKEMQILTESEVDVPNTAKGISIIALIIGTFTLCLGLYVFKYGKNLEYN